MATEITLLDCACCEPPFGFGPSGIYGSGSGRSGAGFGTIVPGDCPPCSAIPVVYKVVVSGIANGTNGGMTCTNCVNLNGTYLLYYRGIRVDPWAVSGTPMGAWWSSNETVNFNNCNPMGVTEPDQPRWTLQCSSGNFWHLSGASDGVTNAGATGGVINFNGCLDSSGGYPAWNPLGSNDLSGAHAANLSGNNCDYTGIAGSVTAVP